MARCKACNTDFVDGALCPFCGHPGEVILKAEPGTYRVEGFAPTITIGGRDPSTGDERINVNAPGMTSETRLTQDGYVTLNVEGVEGILRAGEPQALRTLRQRLQMEGVPVSIGKGQDSRGEDAVLTVGSANYTIQLVTSPSVPEFWSEARSGSAMTRVQLEQAVGWVRSTLERKAGAIPPVQRGSTLLALDVRHAGVLSLTTLTEAYLAKFGQPIEELGFASVWIVGPTIQHCTRLGNGRP